MASERTNRGRRRGRHETRALATLVAGAVVVALVVATTAALVAPTWSETPAIDEATETPKQPAATADLVGPPAAAAPTQRVAVAAEGDDELRRLAHEQGWTGTGTPEDPIRIKVEIDVADGSGLRLADTDLHVIIEDTAITVTGEGDAIQLDDVQHVRLERSHLSGATTGIRIRDSSDVVVANSTVEHARFGVLLQGVKGALVQDSHLAFNGMGIYAEQARNGHAASERVRVVGNTILANDDPRVQPGGGAVLVGDDHSVSENRITGNGFAGVWVLGSRTEVTENRFEAGRDRAVVVHAGSDVVVSGNHFLAPGGAALVGRGTSGLHITGNQFQGASTEAVRVGDDNDTRIEGNRFETGPHGIVATGSKRLSVLDNDIHAVGQAIDLVAVRDAIMTGNTMSNITVGGINLFRVQAVVLEQNHVTRSAGHGIYIGTDSRDVTLRYNEVRWAVRGVTIDGNARDVWSAQDLVLGPCATGFNVIEAANVLVEAAHVWRCDTGIRIEKGTGHHIDGGAFTANFVGIGLGPDAAPVRIEGVTARENAAALQITTSSGHALLSSELVDNTQGVVLLDASGIEIAHNWVRDNRIGLHFVNATANRVYDNLVVNDRLPGDQDHLIQNSPGNLWNATERDGPNVIGGPRIGGNLWRDYEGPDTDADGLGDVPYWPIPAAVPGENVLGIDVALEGPLDMHPLVAEGDPEHGPSPTADRNDRDEAPASESGGDAERPGGPGAPNTPELPLRQAPGDVTAVAPGRP